MKYQANAVSSFFYYMWNAWCEEEWAVFKEMHRTLLGKIVCDDGQGWEPLNSCYGT